MILLAIGLSHTYTLTLPLLAKFFYFYGQKRHSDRNSLLVLFCLRQQSITLQLHRTVSTDRNVHIVERGHGARCRTRPQRMLAHVQSDCVEIMALFVDFGA